MFPMIQTVENGFEDAVVREALSALEKRKRRRYRVATAPKKNTICPHPDGEVVVLDCHANRVTYCNTRITNKTVVCQEAQVTFHRKVSQACKHGAEAPEDDRSFRVRKGMLDDLVEADVLIAHRMDERGTIDLMEFFHQHDSITPLRMRSHENGWRQHWLTFDSWLYAQEVLDACPFLTVQGLDLNAPDHLIPWLSGATLRARLSYPTQRMAQAIEAGRRISLSECHRQHVWFSEQWTGDLIVNAVHTEGGYPLYELLGKKHGTNALDWLCDLPSATEAVDLAALIHASAAKLLEEIQECGKMEHAL